MDSEVGHDRPAGVERDPRAFDAPGEVWLTLARLDATRLERRIQVVGGRRSLAWIRWNALATTWGMDWAADEWAWRTRLLDAELADLIGAFHEESLKILNLTRELEAQAARRAPGVVTQWGDPGV